MRDGRRETRTERDAHQEREKELRCVVWRGEILSREGRCGRRIDRILCREVGRGRTGDVGGRRVAASEQEQHLPYY